MSTSRNVGNAVDPKEFFASLFAEADGRDLRPLERREYGAEEFFAHLFGCAPESAPQRQGRHGAAGVCRSGVEPLAVELERGSDGRVVCKHEVTCGVRTTWGYRYDRAGRLVAVERGGVLVEEYAYDAAGHRGMARTEATGMRPERYVYSGDRLMSAGGETFSYAARGGLIASRDALGETHYLYEGNGGLGRVDLPDGRVVAYVLNEAGQPLEKFVDGRRTERFRWLDPLRLGAYRDVEHGVTMCFHYGQERSPLSMTLVDGRGERDYRLGCDQVGTLKAVADGEGNLIKAMQYDSFGGPIHDTAPALYIPIGFGGGLRDRHTGLVRFVNRDYAPRTGRFTAPDPMGDTGGDHDLYEYCVDDPINAEDPWGLEGGVIPGADELKKEVGKSGKIMAHLEGLTDTYKTYGKVYDQSEAIQSQLKECMDAEDIECLDGLSDKRKQMVTKGAGNVFLDFLQAISGSGYVSAHKAARNSSQGGME